MNRILCLAAVAIVAVAAPAFSGERAAPIAPEVYAKRRAALVARLREKDALPAGAYVTIRSGEQAEGEHDLDFRVRSDFYYLSGIDAPGASIEIGPDRDALLLPARDRAAERWEGPRLTAEDPRAAALGFKEVGTTRAGKTEKVSDDLDSRVRREIAALRLVKDEHEIARLRRACAISALAHAEAGRSIEPGMAEFEVDALVRYVFRREGAERAGYPSIVGSGPNSCFLHYNRNDRVMRAGDLVVLDAGAEFGRYTADVTRTFPVSGRFTEEQRRVYDAVLRAQDAGIAAVRPGATVREVHRAAAAVLAEAGLARYFFHGTSHWLGLDVHDVGDYDAKLAPGMVLTVEPGAYIEEKALGVRIEDDVLVTPWGCEVLTAAVPRRADEIEAVMREKGLGNAPIRPLPPPPKPIATF
jgi:Xaa-Pro aminopeptidase